MSDAYDRYKAALHNVGVHPYIVNEKNPSRGYDRMWKIFVPASNGKPAKTIWTADNPDARDQALAKLVLEYVPAD